MFVKKYKPEDWLQFESIYNNFNIKITTQAIDFEECARQVLKQTGEYDETLVRILYDQKNWIKLQYKHSVSVNKI